MSDALTKYVEAVATYERAKQRVAAMAKTIKTVGDALDTRPSRFSATGVPPVAGIPAEAVIGSTSYTLDGANWPSALHIMENVAALHVSYDAMQAAWRAVPEELRSSGGLKAPPTGR